MVIPLKPEAADYLAALESEAAKVVAMRDAAFTMLLRCHGITEAKNPRLDGLTLTVDD